MEKSVKLVLLSNDNNTEIYFDTTFSNIFTRDGDGFWSYHKEGKYCKMDHGTAENMTVSILTHPWDDLRADRNRLIEAEQASKIPEIVLKLLILKAIPLCKDLYNVVINLFIKINPLPTLPRVDEEKILALHPEINFTKYRECEPAVDSTYYSLKINNLSATVYSQKRSRDKKYWFVYRIGKKVLDKPASTVLSKLLDIKLGQ